MHIFLSDISSPDVLHLFSKHDDFIVDFWGKDSIYYTRYSEKEKIDKVWVAYHNDVPVGCVVYRVKSQGVGEVKRMFISSEYRGNGLSKSFLSVVEEHAKQCGNHTLHLDTRVTLELAVTIYRKFGFTTTLSNGLYIEMEKKL